ncbi:toxin-activating lysine-acyltransferase [Rhizobium sophorae]|uniref:RTX toxin-activating lysine-acyltransferase n=1 Tax=Rhizobium sophorae TaxID=1535242 RepID=A0A7Y3S5P1_9HYPH|nr:MULTISPECIES: toxin-activating lysine-acyltransferase [Rhizobium]MBB4388427.1 hemolysin-activating ACP:hemolysin acyltransferase [Rhizobium leguminosarum]NNU37070.1 toxin-activating lysine-acyltransferase [Rhizobium sophorae]PCK83363.1 toxin-activating lysine-acyltransferase RzcC [Rhizobium sophoriradicis]PDS72466.1 toxin-activating lysine-acyltransferase RzcC [Rhizobium sp. L43]ULJ76827.1 toxin-activating lysine-acyltransferase [Rhizobium sp. C104]
MNNIATEASAKSSQNPLSDETKKKLAGAKAALQSTFGQVVLAMSSVPRYRSQMLSDLHHLVVDPLINDRIAIATPKAVTGIEPPAIAIWATVSAEVDARISEQAKAGVFPARLKPEDWKSGEVVWLLDVIAPTRELATMVLANFHQVAKRGDIKIHPMVAHLVDREILGKLTNGVTSAAASSAEFGNVMN